MPFVYHLHHRPGCFFFFFFLFDVRDGYVAEYVPDRATMDAVLNPKEGATETGGDSANRISTYYQGSSGVLKWCGLWCRAQVES